MTVEPFGGRKHTGVQRLAAGERRGARSRRREDRGVGRVARGGRRNGFGRTVGICAGIETKLH